MEQFVEGRSPYEIMGIERGATAQEVKKAWNKLVLVKHPDKAKTPNAAEEFDELKKAYAVLQDKSARAALDDYLETQAQRDARVAQQGAKRQRMREELERREAATGKARSEEETARARLKVELEALRAKAQQEQQERQLRQQQAAAAAAAASRAASSAGAGPSGRAPEPVATAAHDAYDDDATELLRRTVKVSWDPHTGHYSTERLRSLFGDKFLVEDVILKDSSSSKSSKIKGSRHKASALVVLDNVAAAAAAAHEVLGDRGNPLLITPYLKVTPEGLAEQQQQQAGAAAAAGGGGRGGGARPAAPLFAAAATARPVQRPSKPLFPGAQPSQAGDAVAAGGAAGGAPSSKPAFSSFPGLPPSAAASGGGGAAQSSGKPAFSSFPSSGKGGGSGGFEDSVLEKLQQRAQAAAGKQ